MQNANLRIGDLNTMSMETFTPSETDIVHRTRVDLILRPVQNTIHIVQYDDGLPLIEVELYRNGSVYLFEGINFLKFPKKEPIKLFSMISTNLFDICKCFLKKK